MRNLTLVIAASLAISCSDSPSAPEEPTTVLGFWELVSFERAGEPAASIEPGLFTADFTADGRVSARADCNRCSASFTAAGTRIEVGPLACTRAYCGETSLFDDYAEALGGATSFERSSSSLGIRYAGGNLRFVPRPYRN